MGVNIKHRTARGVLVAAQALIARPEHWTKMEHARTTQPGTRTDGGPVLPTDPDASCWCADGAMLRALSGPQGRIDLNDDEILEQLSFSPSTRKPATCCARPSRPCATVPRTWVTSAGPA